jgi:hypothetical protein
LENDATLGVGAADMHGNVENVVYSQCIINSYAQMSGKNVSYLDCTIYGRGTAYYTDGGCIYGSEIVGGTFRIEDCEFISWGDMTSFGGIHFILGSISEDFRLVMYHNLMENRAAAPGSGVRIVKLVIGDSSPPASRIDVDIQGLNYKASAAANQVLSYSGSNDISTTSSVIVDNITAPSGSTLFGSSNGANYVIPMRMQRQTYKQTVTTPGGSGATASSSTWTFRYPYPRVPSITATAGSSDGSLQTPYRGGKVCVPFARSYSVTASVIGVHTADNATFGSSEDITLYGVAEISEI